MNRGIHTTAHERTGQMSSGRRWDLVPTDIERSIEGYRYPGSSGRPTSAAAIALISAGAFHAGFTLRARRHDTPVPFGTSERELLEFERILADLSTEGHPISRFEVSDMVSEPIGRFERHAR